MPRNDPPVGGEFSPVQTGLPVLLQLANNNLADWQAVEPPAIFSSVQRAYLKALVNLVTADCSRPYLSRDIETLAAATYQTAFNTRDLVTQVLYPLQNAGCIDVLPGAKGSHDMESPLVAATAKLTDEIVTPRMAQLKHQTQPNLWPLLSKSLRDIHEEVATRRDHQASGRVLMVLAFKLMRLIDLPFAATNLRCAATHRTPGSLIFECDRLVFPRWQIRCTNANDLSVDDIAIEIGLTHITKSDAIVVTSTGEIGADARRCADKIMADTKLFVILMDGSDLALIAARPVLIVELLNRETHHALRLKKLGQQNLDSLWMPELSRGSINRF